METTTALGLSAFSAEESFALAWDAEDPLAAMQNRFHLPQLPDGSPKIYFCGHSLGLAPRAAAEYVGEEIRSWAEQGIDGYFSGPGAWYHYQDLLRPGLARLVGARESEVVAMNGLSVNLHLLLTTFYRPTLSRHRILVDAPTFPSDLYVVQSQARHHGFDPAEAVILQSPLPGEHTLRTEEMLNYLSRHGDGIALVLLSGVNYFTGQRFDIPAITAAAHRVGAYVGWDLAHAVGNVPLSLHDWEVDFAVWCHYKYVCAGPGAVAGCFVHDRHGSDTNLARFAGWWGNDPKTRFRMHLEPQFHPMPGAAGWQVSCPPIVGLAPLRASLAIFDETGLDALRRKSVALTEYLLFLLDRLPGAGYEVITPRDPAARGSMISLLAHRDAEGLFRRLAESGVVGDFRPPNVVRVAPVPFWNTFHEVWRFVQVLERQLGSA